MIPYYTLQLPGPQVRKKINQPKSSSHHPDRQQTQGMITYENLWWNWSSYRAVIWLFVGSLSSGIIDLLWKEKDNLSLSPQSNLSLLYSLLPHRKLITIIPTSFQERIPQNSPSHQQAASLISPAFRCFSIQKCFIATGFWRRVTLILWWSVYGVQLFGWTQSSSKPLRYRGCTVFNIPLLQMAVGFGILSRTIEFSSPCQLLLRIHLSQIKCIGTNCLLTIIYFSQRKYFHLPTLYHTLNLHPYLDMHEYVPLRKILLIRSNLKQYVLHVITGNNSSITKIASSVT